MSCCARFFAFVLLTVSAGAPAASTAADAYPSKPIRLVVPFAPGGGTDVLSRIVAQHLTESLGQPVVVENKPGAGGAVGAEAVVRAPADGYTLYVGSSATTMLPGLYKNLSFDPIKDFVPVAMIGSSPFVLIVSNSLPAKTVPELLALAKAKPNALNYGSAGNGSVNHVGMELFKSMAQIEIQHVPYKGSAAALNDVLSGQLSMMLDTVVSAMPHIKGGKVRALAVTSVKRSALAPDLPTVAENGVPGFEVTPWYCILAPVGTPDAVVRKLNQEVNKALASAAVRERFASLGAEPAISTSADLGKLITAEERKWTGVIKQSNTKVD